jgi:hypothetical protein
MKKMGLVPFSDSGEDDCSFPTERIQVAPENSLIYDDFSIDNADDLSLAESIQKNGIGEPLVLSEDCVLLSGHRRLKAAECLGLTRVPVRIIDVIYGDLSKNERLTLLRSFNHQREKSPTERVREQMLEIDPDEAYDTLIRNRAERYLDMPDSNVEMGDVKKRARITTARFLEAAQRVIQENREYWPMTVRRVHYLLLNDPPLKHDKKRNSHYGNDPGSYKALTNLLIRARLTGDLPLQAIEDTTRPIQLGGGFFSFAEFIRQESEYFLTGYSRNLMQGQPHHIEIMLEKNALRTVIEKVARAYCIPVTTGRGFSSLSPRNDLYHRFKRSGKKKLILLMLTDFDPDGEVIASCFARSLRDDFGLTDIHGIKVALTSRDVESENFPSDLDAKSSSPNYVKFVEKYGSKTVELDAAPVEFLQGRLRESIENVIDVNEFNAQIGLEKEDAAYIMAYRKAMIEAMGGGSK